MEAVTGIFFSQSEAEGAVKAMRATGIPADKITLLTPGDVQELEALPFDSTEQPGMGKAMGALLGAATGLSGGALLVAAVIPGVGPVTAAGLLGGAILAAAGATVGASVGGSMENSTTEGLPEDEIFVYEDALRKGRTVVIAFAHDQSQAEQLRELLRLKGSEAIDVARHQWWIGLRSAEREHYSASGKSFADDEKFYRLGFEAALHAKSRCKEFDQVSAEMARDIEELEQQHPGSAVAEAYTRGYQRGREYYQHLCDEKKAA